MQADCANRDCSLIRTRVGVRAGRLNVCTHGEIMRKTCLLIFALLTSGCATMTFTSQKPAETVSECIANGWRKVPRTGMELPVSVTRTNAYYFVDVVLARDFPTGIPIHSIWARVRPGAPGTDSGSTTEYRRNFQITNEKIDLVVTDCQNK